MPYIRSIAFIFFVIILFLAFFSFSQPYGFTSEFLWWAFFLSLILVLMSFFKNFFLDLVVLLMELFFIQRIIVLNFWPEEMLYSKWLIVSSEDYMTSIIFITSCMGAVFIGFFGANLLLGKKNNQENNENFDNVNLFIGKISFESLFKNYALLYITMQIMQLFLLLFTGIGVKGYDFDMSWTIFYRIITFFDNTWFLAFIVLLKKDFPPTINRLAKYSVVIFILLLFLKTAKGALVSVFLTFIISTYFVKHEIPKKYFGYGFLIVLFVSLVYYPLMLIIRIGVVGYLYEGAKIVESIGEELKILNFQVFSSVLKFSLRLSEFDWLVAFVNVGREAFPDYIGLKVEIFDIINTFFLPNYKPIDTSGYIVMSKLMPMVFYGASIEQLTGHGENMGIAGMAYLYFGFIGGIVFFFLWSLISIKLLQSKLNIIWKILFCQSLVIIFFVGGSFTTLVKTCYEGYLGLVIVYSILKMKISIT